MKLSSIESNLRGFLRMNYNGLVDESKLTIDFSKNCPFNYENKRINNKTNPIININGYYCDYLPPEEKITIYLPVIDNDRLLPFSDDLLVRLLLWDKIGNWLTHTLSFHPDTDRVPKIASYNNCGDLYRSFCSSSFAFQFVKDSIRQFPYDVYLYKTSGEYKFLKLFQKFNGVEYKLPGLSTTQIFGLIQHARYENRLLTRDFIMDFYTGFIKRILGESPHLVNRFKDFFSEKQREYFKDDSDMSEK